MILKIAFLSRGVWLLWFEQFLENLEIQRVKSCAGRWLNWQSCHSELLIVPLSRIRNVFFPLQKFLHSGFGGAEALMCPGSSFRWSGFGGHEFVQLGTAQPPLSRSAAFCCPGVFGEKLCSLTLQANSYFILVFFNFFFSPLLFPVGHCFCLILYIYENYCYNLRNIYRQIHKVLLQSCSIIGGLWVP